VIENPAGQSRAEFRFDEEDRDVVLRKHPVMCARQVKDQTDTAGRIHDETEGLTWQRVLRRTEFNECSERPLRDRDSDAGPTR
jgi:hypothetical protein